jgi:hypothetical protein
MDQGRRNRRGIKMGDVEACGDRSLDLALISASAVGTQDPIT